MATSSRSRSSGKSNSKGLSPAIFGGLDKKRIESKGGGNYGLRVVLKQGDTAPVQFLGDPDDQGCFIEYEIHGFKEDGNWQFVPCAGDDCPLCSDEDDQRRRTSYRFAAVVYNLKEKKVQILEGPKDLAQRIYYRFSRRPSAFLGRVYDVTKFPTTPVTYAVDRGDDDPVAASRLEKLERPDLEKYVASEMERYYGTMEIPKSSALDDEEDDEEEEERPRRRRSSSSGSTNKRRASSEDEDDDDDEDERPRRRSSTSTRRSTSNSRSRRR